MTHIGEFRTTQTKSLRVRLIEPEYKRQRDSTWDFKGVAASTGVYGIHPYPAMFHFGVVRELVKRFSKEGDNILDPFVGSGVTAVECLLAKRNFVGYDINPLAILISKVRCTPIARERLRSSFERTLDRFQRLEPEPVSFNNIDYWFEKQVIRDLSRLKRAIFAGRSIDTTNFQKVVLSEVVRRVSNTRYNEFKLFRRAERNGKTDAIKIFSEVFTRNTRLLSEMEHTGCPPRIELSAANIQQGILQQDGSFDLVVTSPPYGDSRTTVAYGQFSRLSLQWMGLEEQVDRTSLGSRARPIERGLPSPLLYSVLKRIIGHDLKRGREVFAFYWDLFDCICQISRKVKRGGYVCLVVGNRKVKGQELPTDAISADFFVNLGYSHETTLVRAISNKRMPLQNSPTNEPGIKDSTMRYEYIVVLRKR